MFFWYRLTRVFPDKFHRAVKRLCCVCVWRVSDQEVGPNKTWREVVQKDCQARKLNMEDAMEEADKG